MSDLKQIVLGNDDQQMVLATPADAMPELVYWGCKVAESDLQRDLWQAPAMSVDAPLPPSIFPLYGFGFMGEPALLAHRENGSNIFRPMLADCSADHSGMQLRFVDDVQQIEIFIEFEWHTSGVIAARCRVQNSGEKSLHVNRLNSLSLPLPNWCTEIDATFGQWSGEGHSERFTLPCGKFEQITRSGKPGHNGGPFLLLTSPGASERHGRVIAATLAHSSNFHVAVERHNDGSAQAFLAEWLAPGEVTLAQGESYETPTAYFALSETGLSGISNRFHEFTRALVPSTRENRPVSLNSWEAFYFQVDQQTVTQLAATAKAIGCERLVIDDGWFQGRPDDHSGLGDWVPDSEKFSDGFGFLDDLAANHKMAFGIWFEPEMVNPDSQLARQHPQWILRDAFGQALTGRNQWVLDLSQSEVIDYLFDSISTVLQQHQFQYIKWDCNRDLFPALANNRPCASRQVAGLYQLLTRLREAFPALSIESCASGGGRMDFGILAFTDRFWASDCTDPVERVRIQRRASIFFPPELIGAHVSASPNHFTGRTSTMVFRCVVAFFGHFGVELDPARLNEKDRTTLANTIKIYKTYRDILLQGQLLRFDETEPGCDVQMILSRDGKTALVRALRIDEARGYRPKKVRVPGLPADQKWALSEILLEQDCEKTLTEMSSEGLGQVGAELLPEHANSGRLFVLKQCHQEQEKDN
ncbi:alpha-galactosidase [Porticoccus sp. GXU_MW_L64]